MTSKPDAENGKSVPDVVHPGMMGDGTEEQNLNEKGDPSSRITKAEVNSAFAGKTKPKAGAKR